MCFCGNLHSLRACTIKTPNNSIGNCDQAVPRAGCVHGIARFPGVCVFYSLRIFSRKLSRFRTPYSFGLLALHYSSLFVQIVVVLAVVVVVVVVISS